jgi:hypothetical protein
VSEIAVKETFRALFALTDLRQIFRETKPNYTLNKDQKEKVHSIIENVRQSLDIIETELL